MDYKQCILNYLTTTEHDNDTFPIDLRDDVLEYSNQFPDSPKKYNLLGLIYKLKYKDIPKAIKYFELAIENGVSVAMHKLGDLYCDKTEYKDIPKAIKYYEMAIEKGVSSSMHKLGDLYCDKTEYKDIPKAIKYYEMIVEKGDTDIIHKLLSLFTSNSDHFEQYIIEHIKNKKIIQKQSEYITELEYMPNGVGYQKAYKEFTELQKTQ